MCRLYSTTFYVLVSSKHSIVCRLHAQDVNSFSFQRLLNVFLLSSQHHFCSIIFYPFYVYGRNWVHECPYLTKRRGTSTHGDVGLRRVFKRTLYSTSSCTRQHHVSIRYTQLGNFITYTSTSREHLHHVHVVGRRAWG